MFCRFKARQKVKLKLERRATLNKKIPLYRQVYEELRKDIMEGIYQPGEYLPPIREEAKRLGVARNTIENAYLMLAEEGYVQAKRGQGSRISDAWRSLYFGEDVSGEKAEELSYLKSAVQHAAQAEGSGGREAAAEAPDQSMEDRTGIKRHGETEQAIRIDFRGKPPILPMFPRGIGSMLETRLLQDCKDSGEILAGERVCSLIRRYLKIYRGVTCAEEQIFLCRSHKQAVRMVQQVQPRILYTIPHHAGQGSNHISPEEIEGLYRRMEQEKLYVLEDDADGEVVYDRKPFSTLFGGRAGERIILTGTLDRFFVPALSLHYVVFPQEIMEIKTSVLSRICRDSCFSLLELEMLDLILSWERLPNHYRKYYYRNFLKRNHVIRCMEEAFGSCAVLHRTESGTEIIAAVPCTEEASVIMNRAAEAGLGLDARSGWGRDSRQLYVRICYENISMEDIEEGIRILSGILGFQRSEI